MTPEMWTEKKHAAGDNNIEICLGWATTNFIIKTYYWYQFPSEQS